jgi:HlyD family secretion protein
MIKNTLARISGSRLWLALLPLILLAALGAYSLLQPDKTSATVTVTRGDIRATVTANGRVRATHSARLAFPLSGQLGRVLVQEGDRVRAGDLLAELRSDDFDRRIKQAELALSSRQLDLQRAQAAPRTEDLDIAQANVKKAALALAAAEDNYKKNPSSASQGARESAQADYDIARASFDRLTRGPTADEIQQLKNSIQVAQLDLDAARAQRAQTELRAPYDAIVTDISAQPGELIGGYAPFLGVADLTSLEVFAEIDEIDVGAVSEGQSVQIRLDAFPGQNVKGQVTRLFPAASNERGAFIYHARVSFDAGELRVRPGMGATLQIATVERKNVLLVPSRAIKNAGSQKIVSVLLDGTPRNVVVQTGMTDGNQTEIVSGLDEGATVVVE